MTREKPIYLKNEKDTTYFNVIFTGMIVTQIKKPA